MLYSLQVYKSLNVGLYTLGLVGVDDVADDVILV